MQLSVPYYSQFVDVDDPFWMPRACGAVCLTSVLEFYGKEVPSIITLCNEAKDSGGYDMENGWVHDYLVKKAQDYGLTAYRKEGLTDLTECISFLADGKPVIISVEKRVLEQTRFHMITLVGYEVTEVSANTDAPITKYEFYYHESESTNKEKGKYRKCTQKTLMNYWRGKAIFISK